MFLQISRLRYKYRVKIYVSEGIDNNKTHGFRSVLLIITGNFLR